MKLQKSFICFLYPFLLVILILLQLQTHKNTKRKQSLTLGSAQKIVSVCHPVSIFSLSHATIILLLWSLPIQPKKERSLTRSCARHQCKSQSLQWRKGLHEYRFDGSSFQLCFLLVRQFSVKIRCILYKEW